VQNRVTVQFQSTRNVYSQFIYPSTGPAMAAGITDHVWSIEEIVNLMNC
jgi:hypothetical protein